jgi:uncharacterized protein (TIGR02266 family)
MTAERRRHPRVKLDVAVDVTTPSNFYTGRTRDISEGGVFVDMPLMPEPGTEVGIRLQLGRRVFDVVARVAWVLNDASGASVGFGAEFVSLPPGAKRAILAFIEKRDPVVFDFLDDADDGPKGPPPLPG